MEEKAKTWAAYTVLLFGGGFLVYLFFRYLAGVLLPFLIGWGIALLVRRPADLIHKKTRAAVGAVRLLLALFFTLLLGIGLYFGLRGLFVELSRLVEHLGEEPEVLFSRLRAWLASIPLIGERLAGGRLLEAGVSMLLSAIPALLASLAGFLPSFFFTFGVALIAAVYFCLDLERVHGAILSHLPHSLKGLVQHAKDSALRAALSVLRAQGMLMLIAFAFMLFGFVLLGVKYPLLLSGIFALLDVLPVIGVGLFLVPWGLFALFSGNRVLGIGLLVLYLVIGIVRQVAEPRLLGRGYGVHPLLTLLSLYAGGRLLDVWGLLLFPAVTLLLYETLVRKNTDGSVPEEKKTETNRKSS